MNIQKITADKYLYKDQIVNLSFLQSAAQELQTMIKENEKAISEIELIELIPQIKGVAQYCEAAELYNSQKIQDRDLLEQEGIHFNSELNEIKKWL